MKQCSICGITENETRIIKGYCRKHYLQIYRYGKIIERTIYDKNEYKVENDIVYMNLYDKSGELVNIVKFNLTHLDKVKQYKWYCRNSNGKLYACTTINGNKVFLHRLIMNTPKGMVTDHIDRDTMNNLDNNLRICTLHENDCNRVYKASKDKHPGVYQQYGLNGNWSARITYNYKTIYLGTFLTYEDALEARKKAESKYFREFVPLVNK